MPFRPSWIYPSVAEIDVIWIATTSADVVGLDGVNQLWCQMLNCPMRCAYRAFMVRATCRPDKAFTPHPALLPTLNLPHYWQSLFYTTRMISYACASAVEEE
jgi:hypothetical protein